MNQFDSHTPLDIENSITTIADTTRTNFYLHSVALTDEIRSLIRQWLKKKGMNERAIINASDRVLVNAYRAGDAYIRKVNEDDRPRFGGTPKTRRRGFNPLGDAVEIDFDSTTRDLLTRAMDEMETPFSAAPTPVVSSTIQPTTKINEADIARAAAAVIGPRITAAKEELTKQVNQKITEAANAFSIGPAASSQIKEIAGIAAQEIAADAISSATKIYHETIAILSKAIPRRIEVITPKSTKTFPAVPRHKIFPEVLEALLVGEHVYLVGEAGTGKTFLFRQLGEALSQPTTVLGQTLTKYEFSGHLGPTGEYVSTLLRVAVEEGHLLCIDEIDSSASAAIVFLNSLLANKFIAFPDKMVEAHPDFKVIAAANTFGFGATTQYIGRNPLDAASLDRFTYIECHYDEDLERLLYGDTPWTTYVHRVRKAVNQLELKHIISMRAIERGKKLLNNGADTSRVCTAALWRNLDPDTISRITNLAGTFSRQLSEAA